MLSCIITDVIRGFVLFKHVELHETRHAAHTKDPNTVYFVRFSAAFLRRGSAASVKSSDVRASPPLLSPSCGLSQRCEASRGFYYRGGLIKAQHFDDFAAASRVCALSNASACVSQHLSAL